MQDGHFIVNVHEHPGDHAAENSAWMGIDMAVPLPVGAEAMTRAAHTSREWPHVYIPFYLSLDYA